MPAPKGNRFWEARSRHGRKPIFESKEQLSEACQDYFQWVEENPLYEAKAFSYQGDVTITELPKMRAMTIGGLCIFIDITQETWGQYRKKQDFSEVCARVEQIIRNQKFVGASADLLNPSIIARDLGLVDKQEHTGEDGGPIQVEDVTNMELARRIAFTLKQAEKEDA